MYFSCISNRFRRVEFPLTHEHNTKLVSQAREERRQQRIIERFIELEELYLLEEMIKEELRGRWSTPFRPWPPPALGKP
jgi:hypothetical protein